MTDNDFIDIDTKASAKRITEAARVPIFAIDGRVYDIADAARADLGLAYINRVVEEGEDAASAQFIIDTMGEDAFEALRNVEGLEPEAWQGIQDKIRKVVTPKARTNRATRRA